MGHTACHSETKTDVSYAEEFPATVERHSSVTFRALLGALYYGTLSTDRLKGMRDHHPGHLKSTEKLEWPLGFPKDFQEYANNILKVWYIFIGHS